MGSRQWRHVTILAGGGGVRDAKLYFTDMNSIVTLIFCYKFYSTDEFPEILGVYTPTPRTLRPWFSADILDNISSNLVMKSSNCAEIWLGLLYRTMKKCFFLFSWVSHTIHSEGSRGPIDF